VEPFCGGLAVTLGLNPERALLNDVNPHLVNFYRWLRRGLKTDLEMKNAERHFYRHRARFNALLANGKEEIAEAAALFYYLNRTGYNGLCRFNRSGVRAVNPLGKVINFTEHSCLEQFPSGGNAHGAGHVEDETTFLSWGSPQ
jgi:DNA adenine methylase